MVFASVPDAWGCLDVVANNAGMSQVLPFDVYTQADLLLSTKEFYVIPYHVHRASAAGRARRRLSLAHAVVAGRAA